MIIETSKGKIRGVDMGDYTEYRGIPYAAPPVGSLRWKAPQDAEPWDGILDAVKFPNRCMQQTKQDPPPDDAAPGERPPVPDYDREFYSDPAYLPPVSEDCLYLNIWVPKQAPGAPFPVAFWIHGGGFTGGYSSEMEFDGAQYCRRGVILVTVAYRCNVFGFLAHPWLSAENENHISGNYGILDQIKALEFVYENIAAFGGDPQNITIFGQSAGAMSVQTLVSSPLTKDMIAKAILQSGGSYGIGLHRDIPLAEQEQNGILLQEILQVDSLEALRSIPAEKLIDIQMEWTMRVGRPPGEIFLAPTLDHHLLEGTYYGLIDAGRIRDIPYMIGSTRNDILVTPGMIAKDIPSPLYQGSVAFSKKLEELGRKPAYVYYFTRQLPGDDYGAFHSAELWYMFGTLSRCWRPMEEHDYALSSRMLDYWTQFMKTGDPNGNGNPFWAPCAAENESVMELC